MHVNDNDDKLKLVIQGLNAFVKHLQLTWTKGFFPKTIMQEMPKFVWKHPQGVYILVCWNHGPQGKDMATRGGGVLC